MSLEQQRKIQEDYKQELQAEIKRKAHVKKIQKNEVQSSYIKYCEKYHDNEIERIRKEKE